MTDERTERTCEWCPNPLPEDRDFLCHVCCEPPEEQPETDHFAGNHWVKSLRGMGR